MSIKETAFRMEELAEQAWTLSSMVLMLNEALLQGAFTVDAYEGALLVITRAAGKLMHETDQLKEELFVALRNEQEGSAA